MCVQTQQRQIKSCVSCTAQIPSLQDSRELCPPNSTQKLDSSPQHVFVSLTFSRDDSSPCFPHWINKLITMSVSLLFFNISSLLFPPFFALLCSEKQQTTHPLWMSLSLQPTKVLMNRGIVRERFVLSSFCLTVCEHRANNQHPAGPSNSPFACLLGFWQQGFLQLLEEQLESISKCSLCLFSKFVAVALSPVKEDFRPAHSQFTRRLNRHREMW